MGGGHVVRAVPGLSSVPASTGFPAATGAVANCHLIGALLVEEFVCGEG